MHSLQHQHQTLSQIAAEMIRMRIIRGELRPGTRINEVELAETSQMSRGPIREALRELAREGLLTYIPHRGAFVREFSYVDIAPVFDIRAFAEAYAYRTIRARKSDKVYDTLLEIADEMGEISGDNAHLDIVRLDEAFHRAIVQLCPSESVINAWSNVHAAFQILFGQIFMHETETLEEFAVRHRYLAMQLRIHDTEHGALLIEEHYAEGRDRLLAVLAQTTQTR